MVEAIQVSVRGRTFGVVGGRHDGFWRAVSLGAWEPETFAILERFLDPDHSYIDIGSWIGPTVLFGCQLAKAAYAIEPDPIAYAELVTNFALNQGSADNLHVSNLCISGQSGPVAFGSRSTGGDSMSSLLFSDRSTRWTLDALTLSDFIQSKGITDCNFIKCDIEGGEYIVLPRMMDAISACRPTLLLSLHPFYLGLRTGLGLAGKAKRAAALLAGTARILRCLRVYKNHYDVHGAKLRWRELARACMLGLSVVASERQWNASGEPSPRLGESGRRRARGGPPECGVYDGWSR